MEDKTEKRRQMQREASNRYYAKTATQQREKAREYYQKNRDKILLKKKEKSQYTHCGRPRIQQTTTPPLSVE
jgi:5-methylcytosine-specific restriction endonuclease McrA